MDVFTPLHKLYKVTIDNKECFYCSKSKSRLYHCTYMHALDPGEYRDQK